eukprot:c5253_g1_i2.p1 GENE.c5253_g1_i2~~c5253_g1_i2.p1  ORF type:complete len:293 (+),score=29.70 c5253_g1_i2:33-881(+)
MFQGDVVVVDNHHYVVSFFVKYRQYRSQRLILHAVLFELENGQFLPTPIAQKVIDLIKIYDSLATDLSLPLEEFTKCMAGLWGENGISLSAIDFPERKKTTRQRDSTAHETEQDDARVLRKIPKRRTPPKRKQEIEKVPRASRQKVKREVKPKLEGREAVLLAAANESPKRNVMHESESQLLGVLKALTTEVQALRACAERNHDREQSGVPQEPARPSEVRRNRWSRSRSRSPSEKRRRHTRCNCEMESGSDSECNRHFHRMRKKSGLDLVQLLLLRQLFDK